MIDRRTVIAGLGTMAGATIAFAETIASAAAPAPALFAGTPLQDNLFARLFKPLDMPLPSIPLLGASGTVDLARLTGRTRIVTLWAEWCAPCLVEARDLAGLRRTYMNSRFDIVAVLTASGAKLDHSAATARLRKAGADTLPLLVEANGGRRVAQAFSASPPGVSMPCTLLVDAAGQVRGRMLGAPLAMTDVPAGGTARRTPGAAPPSGSVVLTEAEKRAMFGGAAHSLWDSSSGKAFVQALRDGALR